MTLDHSEGGGSTGDACSGKPKTKRKKLKGKRVVVRWLKFFRWQKKKDYERMTVEEKILYKLRKAMDKSKYMDGLRDVRKYVRKLEQDLELLQAQATNNTNPMQHVPNTDNLYGFWEGFKHAT
ncbi:hypothetical protein V6N13_020249 [Hibiscus sabdariffa]|uniref:Uncharacterized protein n=1 Tax=Hibiscus sabdariffa TaxID=183260 RepID=A0ABR2EWY9_9ROSI